MLLISNLILYCFYKTYVDTYFIHQLQFNDRYIISFLKEHGKEVFMDVRAAYIDTMNKVIFFILFDFLHYAATPLYSLS
jgi:hypothetical protein